jgi:pimeloyl-ACP methyl ester carboxylesterase
MKKLIFATQFWYFFLAVLGVFFLPGCGSRQQGTRTPVDSVTAVTSDNAVSVPAAPPPNFKHQTANVNGVNIHYVIGGEGEPLVLVHGFGQNWYMWNRLLPELSRYFTVIAPDLRGLGESDKPEGKYDKKTMATDIHELMKQLGYKRINMAGHDIGLMVAYAYCAQFGREVKKIALMDALLPGVDPVWTQSKNSLWWFGFFAWPASSQLVSGKERLFLTNFWPVVGHVRDAFTPEETNEFVRAYSQSGSTMGAFNWFANFEQDAKDNREFMKQKLTMPMLAMSGEFSAAPYFGDHCRLVASNVKESIIKGAGHWLVQENTAQVQQDLLAFFRDK